MLTCISFEVGGGADAPLAFKIVVVEGEVQVCGLVEKQAAPI